MNGQCDQTHSPSFTTDRMMLSTDAVTLRWSRGFVLVGEGWRCGLRLRMASTNEKTRCTVNVERAGGR